MSTQKLNAIRFTQRLLEGDATVMMPRCESVRGWVYAIFVIAKNWWESVFSLHTKKLIGNKYLGTISFMLNVIHTHIT